MVEIHIRPDFQLEGKMFWAYDAAKRFVKNRNVGISSLERWPNILVEIMPQAGESKAQLEEFIHVLNLEQIDYKVLWGDARG